MDHSSQAAGLFNKHAFHYQNKYMDVSAYGPGLDALISLFPETSPSILEIACGPGNLTRYLLDHLPEARVLGTDLAPAMVDLARVNCPEANFQVMDCRHLHHLKQRFDGVIAGFCLPYLNPEEAGQLIRTISDMLNEKGLLYLSTIEGEREKSGPRKGSTGDELYQYYYTADDLQNWMNQYGFRILRQECTTVPGHAHQDTDLLLIAQKEQ